MSKHILFAAAIFFSFGAVIPVQAQKTKQDKAFAAKKDVKFLDDISINIAPVQTVSSDPKAGFTAVKSTDKKSTETTSSSSIIENATILQFKYALLLNLEVEQIKNLHLFKIIDEWLGTRYRLGGTTKNGIDCSAFMQILFTSLYGIALPRTAREQYKFTRRISRTELREGDLVFFNTIGGVSHVGMYLQNNKFVHASSGGVTISDLYEDYWMKRFVGVGRVDLPEQATALALKP